MLVYVCVFEALSMFLKVCLSICLCLWRSVVCLSINVYLTLKVSGLGSIGFKVCLCF
jgi:hypothetical protein